MLLVSEIGTSEFLEVTDTADEFATNMVPGELWEYIATIATFIAQGEAPTASAGDGSMYVPANRPLIIDAGNGQGAKLSAIAAEAMAEGSATLTRLRKISPLATSNVVLP